jgi:phosphoribosylanthranilate isomerase
MSLSKRVKVGNITNLSDARYCAGMGVDFLSFPSDRVDPKTFGEITGWVSGPQFGLELKGDQTQIESYQPGFIELNLSAPLESANGKPVALKANAEELSRYREKLILHKSQIIFIELHSIPFADLEKTIGEIKEDFQVFVKYEDGNIDEYLQLPVDGISLDGNPEERPGLKEYPIAEILEKMEVD